MADSEPPEPRLDVTVGEIALRMRFSRPLDGALGSVVFLIGAGCSVTAGVPGAVEIAKIMVRDVGRRLGTSDTEDCVAAYRALVQS